MQRNHGPKTSTLTSLRQGTTDSHAVESYYDDWADSYDETLSEWQYRAPDDASGLLAPHLSDGARVLDVGCGTGLLARALRKRGDYTVDGIDISAASLRLAERHGDYAQLIHHDLQNLPLPVPDNVYDAAASVGVLTYIEDAEALLRDLCRCVRPGGAITFTQRTDLWEGRNFPELIARLDRDGLWANPHITPPQKYLPGNEEFSDEVNVIHTLCIVS
ncbi:MAG: methyltransferase domain-containing protein [Sediminimonas qiaohouensis]|uniref:Methyltransferase domain-containing protein n=1 Tax=Sediminimonas qiaohouensis TaxID=552061 RepID=A0A7C9HBZ6_9RHOB|nr:class I SAM-dependent methyltransferase [Sediminimonas qiaohouensis]MTJ05610.1 methyltransferase domain-containing protein [Sediminimonas qiaohouensis]